FCQECGQEAKADDRVCIHCGTKLMDLNQQDETPTEHTGEVEKQHSETRNDPGSNEEEVESNKTEGKRTEQRSTNHKKPMTKKQKLMLQIGAGVLVLLIG